MSFTPDDPADRTIHPATQAGDDWHRAGRALPLVLVALCSAAVTAAAIFIARPDTGSDADTERLAERDHATPADPPADKETADTPPPKPADPLDQPISVDYDRAPLGDVFDHLRETVGTNIAINWPALELVGIDPDSMVMLKLNDVPAKRVLQLVLDQVSADAFDDDKAGYRFSDNMIAISTLRDLKSATDTRVYDIRGMLAQQSIVSLVGQNLRRQFGVNSTPSGGQGGLFGDDSGSGASLFSGGSPSPGSSLPIRGKQAYSNSGASNHDIRDTEQSVPNFTNAPSLDLNDALSSLGEDEDLPSRQEKIDQMFELIQTTVGDPDEWLDEESTLTELNGNLIVKTTPENHAMIAALFANIGPDRALARPGNDLPDDAAERLVRELEKGLIQLEQRQRERFARIHDNPFEQARHAPLSTFSVDVDTASYTYARSSILDDRRLPTADAVRIEEWINYFNYGYTAPVVDDTKLEDGLLTTAALNRLEANDESFVPFTTDVEVADCPWTAGNKLVRIGIKAMEIKVTNRPPAHLVFLLDVSGSMDQDNKLGLVKQGLPMLLDRLAPGDKVSIVVYAGASGLVLEAADAANKGAIAEAIRGLDAGGSTAGGEGIKLAYKIAMRHFVEGGINRVILCTDGDFNVGTTHTGELVELIKAMANPPAAEGERPQGVYLSVMGFGRGNLNDEMMEQISNAGNGNYAYIDRLAEAVKTMSEQASGMLITVAKDVKIQVEFNPGQVASYRLIGYENRVLNDEDFNDDTVDAGDIGAGHSVTALYEIVPAKAGGKEQPDEQPADPEIDELRYLAPRELTNKAELDELLTLKLRFKPVDAAAQAGTSRKIVEHVPAASVPFDEASESTRFAASVAAMGMVLRGSPHRGEATAEWVLAKASNAVKQDPDGLRQQFVDLVDKVLDIKAGLKVEEAGDE